MTDDVIKKETEKLSKYVVKIYSFIYAFRLAAKIMIDVLTEGQMRKI